MKKVNKKAITILTGGLVGLINIISMTYWLTIYPIISGNLTTMTWLGLILLIISFTLVGIAYEYFND